VKILSILNYKFSFKKNRKVEILLLDDDYSSLNFENKKVETINFKEINFYYIFLTLICLFFKNKKKLNFKKLYWKLLMDDYDPIVAIGNDVNMRVFSFKEMYPEKKTIAYQLGHYWDIHVERSRDQLSGKKCDYFFIFSEWEKKIFNVIKTEFIVNGSVKNNEKISIAEEKKYDLMFISEFRKLDEKTINKVKKGYHSYTFANKSIHMSFKDVCNIYILNILNKYCNSKNKKICVARTSIRKDKINKISKIDEMNFFNEYLDNFSIEDTDSYTLSEKSEVTICISSNLGPELLSKGKKVLFLNVNSLTNDWPFLLTDEGPFWYKGKNEQKILEKIEYMLSLNTDEWNQVLKKSGVKMNYDPGNSKLKKLVNEICSKR
tara:strand:- start:9300 stop:10430 length:1131 start_codon:yes stop_codon:yes gene_type:complete